MGRRRARPPGPLITISWLRAQRRAEVFTLPGLGLAYDTAYDTLLATVARRDRLDAAIAQMAADSAVTQR